MQKVSFRRSSKFRLHIILGPSRTTISKHYHNLPAYLYYFAIDKAKDQLQTWRLKPAFPSLPTFLVQLALSSGAYSCYPRYGTIGSRRKPMVCLDWWCSCGLFVCFRSPLWSNHSHIGNSGCALRSVCHCSGIFPDEGARSNKRLTSQNFNMPIQIQPQIFCVLSLVSWAQTLIYNK